MLTILLACCIALGLVAASFHIAFQLDKIRHEKINPRVISYAKACRMQPQLQGYEPGAIIQDMLAVRVFNFSFPIYYTIVSISFYEYLKTPLLDIKLYNHFTYETLSLEQIMWISLIRDWKLVTPEQLAMQ